MLKVKFNELLADSLGDGFKTELATGACIASGNTAEKIPAMAVLIKGEAIQMLSYYALPLCGEEYIDISEELSDESDADDVLAFKNEILAKVYSYILRTQDYYSKLISLYETMGDKLLKATRAESAYSSMKALRPWNDSPKAKRAIAPFIATGRRTSFQNSSFTPAGERRAFMNDSHESLAVSGASTLVCGVLSAIQPDEILKYVNLSLAILSALVALLFTFWKWWKEAKKDGKITPDEVGDVLDDVSGIIDNTKDSIGKITEEDKKEKEDKKE